MKGFGRDARHRDSPDRLPPHPRRAGFRGAGGAITRLVYERGEFTSDQTHVVAAALAAFTVGMVFNGWMLLLNRAFYGLQSNWTPTLVALGNLRPQTSRSSPPSTASAVWGLPLAVSLSNLAGAVALAVLMWRRVGGMDAATTLTALTRIVVASVVASGLAVLVWWAVDAGLGRSTVGQILSVGLALASARARTSVPAGSSACASSARCGATARRLSATARSPRRSSRV